MTMMRDSLPLLLKARRATPRNAPLQHDHPLARASRICLEQARGVFGIQQSHGLADGQLCEKPRGGDFERETGGGELARAREPADHQDMRGLIGGFGRQWLPLV